MRYFTRWVLSWDSCHLWVPFMLSISNHLEKQYQKRNWDLIQCFSTLTINLILKCNSNKNTTCKWKKIWITTVKVTSQISPSPPHPHHTLLTEGGSKSWQTLTCTLSTFLWSLLWAWNQLTRSACVIDLRASIWNPQEGDFSSTVAIQIILNKNISSATSTPLDKRTFSK